VQKLLAPREAANILGISYPTLKQWIYHGKIKSVKTPGGHHRVPESEIDRLFPKKLERGSIESRRNNLRKISGRNQLIGRVVAIKFSGLLAQVTLAIGEQHITSIITADAARELRLKPGERQNGTGGSAHSRSSYLLSLPRVKRAHRARKSASPQRRI